MKKILAFLLISVMLLPSLAACNKPTAPGTPSDPTTTNQRYKNGINMVFKSNGDGTCAITEVIVKGELKDKKLIIPATSPDGDTVVSCNLYGLGYNVPTQMSKEDFEAQIRSNTAELSSFEKNLIDSFFSLKDVEEHVARFSDPQKKEQQRHDFLSKYPMAKVTPIYVFTGVTSREYSAISKILDKISFTYEKNLENTEKIFRSGYSISMENASALYMFSEIELPNTLKSVELPGASNLEKLNIPEGVTDIVNLSGCKSLTKITIPDSITSLRAENFTECDNLLKEDNGVSYADKWAIGCKNSSAAITVRPGTVGIAVYAISGSMTEINLPADIKYIEKFGNCSNLETINFGGTKAQWDAIQKAEDWDSGIKYVLNCTDTTVGAASADTVYVLFDATLRSGASLSSGKIAEVKFGTALNRIRVTKKWSEINYNGTTAYIANDLITTDKNAVTFNDADGITSKVSIPGGSPSLNLRKYPLALTNPTVIDLNTFNSASIIGKIDNGTEVNVLSISADGKWAKIECKAYAATSQGTFASTATTMTGYCTAQYINTPITLPLN